MKSWKLGMGMACVCLTVLSGLAVRNAGAEVSGHDAAYASAVGLLDWRGDPPLRGPVRSFSLTAYPAQRGADGHWEKRPEPPSYHTDLTFDQQGRRVRELRAVRQWDMLELRTEYDRQGRVVAHSQVWNGDETHAWRTLTIFEDGRPIREDAVLGLRYMRTEALYEYDAEGRVRSNTDSIGGVRLYAYDGRGNVLREDMAAVGHEDSPILSTVSSYDEGDRPVRREERDLENGTVRTQDFTYDAVGRLTRREGWVRTRNGERKTTFLELLEYDAAGRLARAVLRDDLREVENRYLRDAAGQVGEMVRVITDAGRVPEIERLRFARDAHGNWTRCVRESTSQPAILERVIEYYSDAAGLRPNQ